MIFDLKIYPGPDDTEVLFNLRKANLRDGAYVLIKNNLLKGSFFFHYVSFINWEKWLITDWHYEDFTSCTTLEIQLDDPYNPKETYAEFTWNEMSEVRILNTDDYGMQ